jgi:hypothetical protein
MDMKRVEVFCTRTRNTGFAVDDGAGLGLIQNDAIAALAVIE